jgi:hypothetical protein
MFAFGAAMASVTPLLNFPFLLMLYINIGSLELYFFEVNIFIKNEILKTLFLFVNK